MKKLILISIISLFVSTTINAQNAKTVGSGVIEFLLTNPKSANKMNSTEYAALNVIGGLLRIGGQQDHEINVANAGKTEINITDGSQTATIVKGINGEVYILVDGIVYPLSQSFISQSNENSSSAPTGHDMKQLEKDFNKGLEKGEWKAYRLGERLCYSDVIKKFLQDDLVLYRGENGFITPGPFQKYNADVGDIDINKPKVQEKNLRLFKNTQFHARKVVKTQINTILMANWYNDLAEDGLDFSDLHGVKKQFNVGEKFNVHIPIRVREDILLVHGIAEILDENTGQFVYGKPTSLTSSCVWSTTFSNLKPGKYLISVKLLVNGNIVDTKTENLEITSDPNNIESNNVSETYKLDKNDLPRGLLFYNQKSNENYIGANKAIYDISKKNLHIKLNVVINDNNKNVIYQSFTLDGKLLGTSTDLISSSRVTGPSINPTKDFDYIDAVKNNGPGKYKIKATVEATGEEFIRWVEIK